MSTDLIFIICLIIVIFGHYWFGNHSIWGKLAAKHKLPLINISDKRAVNIGIRVHGKWKGGLRAKCHKSSSGIIFQTNKYLKLFTPPVYLPWGDISEISITNNGFMGTSRTEIKLKDSGVSILVPLCCDLQLQSI